MNNVSDYTSFYKEVGLPTYLSIHSFIHLFIAALVQAARPVMATNLSKYQTQIQSQLAQVTLLIIPTSQ